MTSEPPPSKQASLAKQLADAAKYVDRPVTSSRIAAFNELAQKLTACAKQYESDNLGEQRAAVSGSLEAVIVFLSERGIAPAALEPLARPIHALANRERNNPDKLFSERARGGRPSNSDPRSRNLGIIAACADHWIEHHRDDTRAIRNQFSEIARFLNKYGLSYVSASTIKQAREMVSRELSGHPSKTAYNLMRNGLIEVGEKFGEREAIRLLLPLTKLKD